MKLKLNVLKWQKEKFIPYSVVFFLENHMIEHFKAGLVHCVATEDMDALTFKSKTLLRRLTMPEARKLPVQEISYDKMMKMLDLEHEQFIDLCILMGCDYVPSIKGRNG